MFIKRCSENPRPNDWKASDEWILLGFTVLAKRWRRRGINSMYLPFMTLLTISA